MPTEFYGGGSQNAGENHQAYGNKVPDEPENKS
jgi:hypothetical protein